MGMHRNGWFAGANGRAHPWKKGWHQLSRIAAEPEAMARTADSQRASGYSVLPSALVIGISRCWQSPLINHKAVFSPLKKMTEFYLLQYTSKKKDPWHEP